MLLKSLLTALALLGLYSALIMGAGDRISRTGQTALQRNLVKAEEYLYEAGRHSDTVLVGSSMSERLVADSLPPGCYSLAMGGMSSLDGLQLIRQSGHRPRLILVEANTLMYGHTSKELARFNEPVYRWVGQYLPFMRQKYQPVGVIKAALRDWTYGKNQFVTPASASYVDTTFVTKAVQQQLVGWEGSIPSARTLTANARLAGQYVDGFRRQGVRIVLFDIPTDRRLQQHRRSRLDRQYLSHQLPASRYPTIAAPADAYQTTDGIHLSYNESRRYSSFLRRQLALVIPARRPDEAVGQTRQPLSSPADARQYRN